MSLYFSDLKRFAQSPAHYRHGLSSPREVTRGMRVGTAVDRLLTGGRLPPVHKGDRKSNEWKVFAAAHTLDGWQVDELLTATEMLEAAAVATEIGKQSLAMRYLDGRPQVPLKWTVDGVECETRGIDVVGDGWISDLKVTNSTQPDRFQWHARKMHWHAQLAFYREGCRQNGIDTSKGLYLVGVESSAPHNATVLRLSERTLEEGLRCCKSWFEQYKACEAAQAWPGYCQSVVDFDIPDESGFALEGLEDE